MTPEEISVWSDVITIVDHPDHTFDQLNTYVPNMGIRKWRWIDSDHREHKVIDFCGVSEGTVRAIVLDGALSAVIDEITWIPMPNIGSKTAQRLTSFVTRRVTKSMAQRLRRFLDIAELVTGCLEATVEEYLNGNEDDYVILHFAQHDMKAALEIDRSAYQRYREQTGERTAN
jgi:hypothetical protein